MPDVQPDLAAYARQWQLDTLYLCNSQGTVLDAYGGTAKTLQEAELTQLMEGRIYDTVGDHCFFKTAMTDGRLLVGGRQAAELFLIQNRRMTEAYALSDITVGKTGYVAAINMADGTIAYAKDPALIGQQASQWGLNAAARSGEEGIVSIQNTDWYVRYQQADEDTLFAAIISRNELLDATFTPVGIALAVFAFAVLVLILYSAFIRSDIAAGRIESDVRTIGKIAYDRNLVHKLRGVLLIGVVAVFVVSWYGQSLAALSRQRTASEDTLDTVQEILTSNDARIAKLTEDYQKEYSRRAESIAWALKLNPALVNDDHLAEMAERAQALSIWVFDREGHAVATSSGYQDFVLSSDPTSQSYEFWDVVRGYKQRLVQPVRQHDISDQLVQYVGVQRMDERGMVQMGLAPSHLEARLQTTSLAHVLESVAVENDGYLFAVDMESKQFTAYPKEKYIGRSAQDYGLTASALMDGYIGNQLIDGTSSFLCCQQQGDQLLCVAVPAASVNDSCTLHALIVTIASLFALFAIFLVSVVADANDPRRARQTRSVSSRRIESVRRWGDMLAGQKIQLVAGALLTLIALACLVYIASCRGVYDSSSLLSFILSRHWEHRVNLFSVSYVLIVLLEVSVVSIFMRKVILAVCSNLGSRGETIGRLINNFIKYAAVLGALFYGLTFLGFDFRTLLASAGILTLIIGLGAQTLVSDILAGIFIVFEGEFRVGDIVTIGDWTGEVQEIGIRTTKVRNSGDNVKIFRNSDVTGVVNMTKQLSYASIHISVVHGESLEKVESIIKTELDGMCRELPGLVNGPFFRGITAIHNNSVTVEIAAQCEESDRAALENSLMREMTLALIRNGIDIA